MSSRFAGVSVLAGGELCPSTASSFLTSTDWGYHLLVVQDYSHTKQATPTIEWISSRPFMVGGHKWCIDYFPNGYTESCADFRLVVIGSIIMEPGQESFSSKKKFNVSFIDEAEKCKPMYISETGTFNSHSESMMGYNMFMKKDVLEQSSHLMNDCFTIQCDIMLFSSKDAGGDKVPLPEIDQHLNNILQTKVGADVTFEVSGEMFAAHRGVLAARSKLLMAQLFGPMKEGTTTSCVIQIKDMGAKVFRALLSFIYTD
ncbi:hypothetical protein CFC21_008721 [Triticum aestivum]|uniref:BTB domain-containing protein n=2 Tax=Triticum aestivum TaxID=4565 RepID=A0A9R1DGS8_WHEAT|nr:hypothetical protein CFC21_008721 [Triticum aestivum]